MGLFDKLLVGGGVMLVGALAKSCYKDAQETKRRKNSPLHFDEALTQSGFTEIAHDVAKRTPRVQHVVVTGMAVTLDVGSNSGLSTWTAEIDFNDYGRLTGKYWVSSENSDSLIPAHFAIAMQAQLSRHFGKDRAVQLVGQVASGPGGAVSDTPAVVSAGPGWFGDPGGRHELRYWDGVVWTAYVSNHRWISSDPFS